MTTNPEKPPDTDTHTWEMTPGDEDTTPIEWVQRPWTAEELEARTIAAAKDEARTHLLGIVNDLQAEKARVQVVIDALNSEINSNPANAIKECARASKRIADAVIDLTRILRAM